MEGMSLPEDNRLGPNCGVTAVAVAAGVPFIRAWRLVGFGKRANWKGRSTDAMRDLALFKLGVCWTEVNPPARRTLKTWVRLYAKPGCRYLVRVPGHIVVVKDGIVLDQRGPKPVAEHWCSRKSVRRVQLIDDLNTA